MMIGVGSIVFFVMGVRCCILFVRVGGMGLQVLLVRLKEKFYF
ncbi:hypothetical protein [Helicobacter burdigaliensis]|nr:hypothetical protein [Helicobacter burdigaliensis]